jgi:hypothetical protein
MKQLNSEGQNHDVFPRIVTLFDQPGSENANNNLYKEVIINTLKKILPENIHLLATDPDMLADQREEFLSLLPLLTATPCEKTPANVSFFLISKFRPNAFKFFFEMISHWLVPGKRLNVLLFYAVDFNIPDFCKDSFTLCEVMIHVDNMSDLEILQGNLPIIETEVRLGMQSTYYAQRILEIKGVAGDAKTAMIQECISNLLLRMPKVFENDLLTEMQHVLVICRDEFKAARDCRHLSRIISVHYLFRKSLRESVKTTPSKRHLSLKIFRATIHSSSDNKAVIGVNVGLNFLGDKEVFEERQLLSAIQNYIPNAKAVENSFFANKRGTESICTMYLEIEKVNGEEFSGEEIRLLRRELPTDLRDRIEHLMHPVFMPRNEEEVMRNILALSNQIKYLHDLPQVFISFDEQTHTDVFFTVILLRVMKPGDLSIQDMFRSTETPMVYIHDRSKTIGFLRKKYTKEATVFGVKLAKNQFLRRDYSIDLNKARQTVVSELVSVVGEMRDFNGGMISKQNEVFCALRDLLCNNPKYNEHLLENFFYSLTPDVMRTVLEPKVLKSLFLLMLETIDHGFFSGENYALKMQVDPRYILVMIKSEERSIKESIGKALSHHDFHASKLASSFVFVYEISYLGYLYLCDEKDQQQAFCHALQHSIMEWDQRRRFSLIRKTLYPLPKIDENGNGEYGVDGNLHGHEVVKFVHNVNNTEDY